MPIAYNRTSNKFERLPTSNAKEKSSSGDIGSGEGVSCKSCQIKFAKDTVGERT